MASLQPSAAARGYTVAFDVRDGGVSRFWPIAVVPLVVFLIVTFGYLLRRLLTGRAESYWWLLMLIVGLVFVPAYTIGGELYDEYRSVASAIQDERTEFVAGKVSRFVPMPYEGHSHEVFEVDGRRFEYADFRLTVGFNNTRSHGGPIFEGRRVRLWYVGNTIVRLEVGVESAE